MCRRLTLDLTYLVQKSIQNGSKILNRSNILM
jgi:hypothetical protein